MGSHLAVSAGAFRRSEGHEGPGAGEAFTEFFGLALEEHIFLGVENKRRAGDFLGDPVAKMARGELSFGFGKHVFAGVGSTLCTNCRDRRR
jgi:hypothetical protein